MSEIRKGSFFQRKKRVEKELDFRSIYKHMHPGEDIMPNGQACCHVHGNDNKPSARIYEDNTMYCFACQRVYTPFTYPIYLNGISIKDRKAALKMLVYLEDLFNLESKELPEESDFLKNKTNSNKFINPVNQLSDKKAKETFDSLWLSLNEKLSKQKQDLNSKNYKILDLILKNTLEGRNYKEGVALLNKAIKKINK